MKCSSEGCGARLNPKQRLNGANFRIKWFDDRAWAAVDLSLGTFYPLCGLCLRKAITWAGAPDAAQTLRETEEAFFLRQAAGAT